MCKRGTTYRSSKHPPPRTCTKWCIARQESLTNVVRHSNARQVQISITREEGNLYVRVVDDGSISRTDPTRGPQRRGSGYRSQ